MNAQKLIGITLLIMGLLVELVVISFSAGGLSKLFPVDLAILGVSVIIIVAYLVEISKLGLAAVLSIDKAKGLGMTGMARISILALTIMMIVVTGAGVWSYFKEANNVHYIEIDNAVLKITQTQLETENLNTLIVSIDKEFTQLEGDNDKADERFDSRLSPFVAKVDKIADSLDEAYDARDIAISEASASIDRRIVQVRDAQKETNKLISDATKRVLYFINKAQAKVTAIELEVEEASALVLRATAVGSIENPAPLKANLARLERKLVKAETKLEDLEDDKEDGIEEATYDLKSELSTLSSNIRKLNSEKSNIDTQVASSDARIKRLKTSLQRAEDALADKRDTLESEVFVLLSDNRERMSEIQADKRQATVDISENNNEVSELEVVKATTLSQVGPAKSIADSFGIDGRSAGSLLALFYAIPLVIFGYFMVTFGLKTAYSKAPKRRGRKPATAPKKSLFSRKAK